MIKTIEERVAELVADAPPITDEQRAAVVRIMGPALRKAWHAQNTGAKAVPKNT